MDVHRVWLCTTTAARDLQVQALQLRHRLHLLKAATKPHGVGRVQWKIVENRGKSWESLRISGKSLENHWQITGKSLKKHGKSMENQYKSITDHGNSWKITMITSGIIHCQAMENNGNVDYSQQATLFLKMKQSESEHGNLNKHL